MTGDEDELYPEHAALAGWAKVIGKEYSHIQCQSIDRDEHTLLSSMPELVEQSASYSENVAYRNGARYVEQLEDWDGEHQESMTWQLKEDGCYVITGGAGGIGSEIGRWMAGQAKVQLALLGRTELPAREHWDLLQKEENDQTSVQDIIREIKAIENLGAKVTYLSVDVSDDVRLAKTLQTVREIYGPVRGIVHCAGTGSSQVTDAKTEEEADKPWLPK